MIEILALALKNKIVREILFVLGLFIVIGGIFAFLTFRIKEAEKEANKLRGNNNLLLQQTDGLKILLNTANIVKEVEHDRKIANQQESNSNLANSNYSNSRQRDSSEFTNSAIEAKRNYCQRYPKDSRCRGISFNAQ